MDACDGFRLRWLLACTSLLVACSPGTRADPDVLLVTVDTLRPDYLSMNGYDRPTTPFLDALIARGTYFEQAVSPAPRTTPALASLFTGAYPHTTGVRTLWSTLDSDVVSLAEVFPTWGYASFAVVANSLLPRSRGLARGFGSYESSEDWTEAPQTTAAALRALAAMEAGTPLFAWVHYLDPHVPYVPDPAVAAEFDAGYDGDYPDRFGRLPAAGESLRGYRAYPRGLSKKDVTHRNALSHEVNAHVRRLYAAELRKVDGEIRRLVEAFEERSGERDRQLFVVFTSDHGESLGEHDFYFDHGDYVYNAGIRVPLAFVVPGRPGGRCRGWVSLVDVLPTLAELLERELPAALAAQQEGRSLASCLGGGTVSSAPVFSESGRSFFPHLVERRVRNDVAGRFRAVILDDWKLVWTPFQEKDLRWELYDLSEDPHETRDLYAEDHPEFRRLRPLLEAWLVAGDDTDPGDQSLSEDDLEALRALGYLE